jgi:putative PIN family toxin of toxin-antitoxin system
MIYAVIDTNVIVSALISHNPTAATVLVVERLFKGSITPVYNEEILDEYNEVLHRPKFKLADEDIRTLLEYIKTFGIHSYRMRYNGTMPDEKDRPFYEVSLSKEGSFLVTGNLKHFPTTPQVVSPAELISML